MYERGVGWNARETPLGVPEGTPGSEGFSCKLSPFIDITRDDKMIPDKLQPLCSAPTCSRHTKTRGYCHRHYQQVLLHGRLTPELERVTHRERLACDPVYAQEWKNFQKRNKLLRGREHRERADPHKYEHLFRLRVDSDYRGLYDEFRAITRRMKDRLRAAAKHHVSAHDKAQRKELHQERMENDSDYRELYKEYLLAIRSISNREKRVSDPDWARERDRGSYERRKKNVQGSPDYREHAREQQRKYQRAYLARHPEKRREKEYRKALRKGDISGIAFDMSSWFEAQPKCCYLCGVELKDYHVEHRMPLSRGGKHVPWNLALACPSCNLSKGAKVPWEYAPERFRMELAL